MSQKNQLSILEFSRLTGITRDNLRFYDRIGLLKPEIRRGNGYRCYTRHQLGSAYLIGSLRLLGVGIDDIRQYSKNRTPTAMLTLFAQQEMRIKEEIEKLKETNEIMRLYADMAQEALRHGEADFCLYERKQERIFLCPTFPDAKNEDEAEILAYEYANSHGVNLGCPMGVMVAQESLLSDSAVPTYQYYFKSNRKWNGRKPAGLYAVAYGQSRRQDAKEIYLKLMEFIRAQGLEIGGNVYGEYLLDDLAVQTPDQHYGRMELLVKNI